MRQNRVGIGADGIKSDVTEVQKTRQTDDDIEAPGQHDVDQYLNAEIIDIFQRSMRSFEHNHRQRINNEGRDRDLEEMRPEKTHPSSAFLRGRNAFFRF